MPIDASTGARSMVEEVGALAADREERVCLDAVARPRRSLAMPDELPVHDT
jgi:aspartate aminotransferase-like enzyme